MKGETVSVSCWWHQWCQGGISGVREV